MSKKFLNAPDDVVSEMLDGVCLATPSIARIADQNVLVHVREGEDKVVVISGGGSGHEPAMAGYLGRGMLDAAVCGNVYASPSVEAVLSACDTAMRSGQHFARKFPASASEALLRCSERASASIETSSF